MLRTVDEEDDRLRLGLVLRLGNIRLKTADGLDMANWSPFMDFAGKAARAHPHACRHDGYGWKNWLR